MPLDAQGITIRPIRALNGKQAFAEVFFDDVRVSVDNRIGDEGQGWNVAMATAGFERGLLLRSPARFQRTAQRLVQLYRRHREQADRDPVSYTHLDVYKRQAETRRAFVEKRDAKF